MPTFHHKRINFPGATHFTTFVCYRRTPLLEHQPYREIVFDSIRRTQKKFDSLNIQQIAVLNDHIHMLYQITDDTQATKIIALIKSLAGFHIIKSMESDTELLKKYSEGLRLPANHYEKFRYRKYRVFQESFHDRVVTSEIAFKAIFRYVQRNPIKHGLAKNTEESQKFLFVPGPVG